MIDIEKFEICRLKFKSQEIQRATWKILLSIMFKGLPFLLSQALILSKFLSVHSLQYTSSIWLAMLTISSLDTGSLLQLFCHMRLYYDTLILRSVISFCQNKSCFQIGTLNYSLCDILQKHVLCLSSRYEKPSNIFWSIFPTYFVLKCAAKVWKSVCS